MSSLGKLVPRPSTLSSAPSLFLRRSHSCPDLRRLSFENELKQHGHLYAKQKGQKPVDDSERRKVLAMYDISASSRLPLILGPSPKVWIPSLLQNFGGASINPFMNLFLKPGSKFVDQAMLQQKEEQLALQHLRYMSHADPDHLKKGSILFEAFWSLAINDGLIQGAIDGGKEIHIASSAGTVLSIQKDLLYDKDNNRPTVLGRELLNIAAQGYVQYKHDHPELGVVLIPSRKPSRRSMVSLKDRIELIDNIKDINDIHTNIASLDDKK